MKKILISVLLLVFFTSINSQPAKNPLDSIKALAGGNLYQYPHDKPPRFVGTFISKDNNGNIIIGQNPTLTGITVDNFIYSHDAIIDNSLNNTSFANHIKMYSVRGTFSDGADHHLLEGGNYSTTLGDGNWQGGYAGYVDGSGCENYVTYGRIGGLISRNGRKLFPNEFSNSDIYGLAMVNEGNDNFSRGKQITTRGNNIYVLGYGPTTVTEPGFHIIFGTEKFGVLTDGRVRINGITYTFPPPGPVTPGSVLTNDGNGNLQWTVPAAAPQIKSFMIYDTMGNIRIAVPVPKTF